jgi:hypothetical protein
VGLDLVLAAAIATARITRAQSGRTYRVAKGAELTLRLSAARPRGASS